MNFGDTRKFDIVGIAGIISAPMTLNARQAGFKELVSPAAVQTLLKFATNPNARKTKPGQFIDNSILEELEKSGFVKQLYPYRTGLFLKSLDKSSMGYTIKAGPKEGHFMNEGSPPKIDRLQSEDGTFLATVGSR